MVPTRDDDVGEPRRPNSEWIFKTGTLRKNSTSALANWQHPSRGGSASCLPNVFISNTIAPTLSSEVDFPFSDPRSPNPLRETQTPHNLLTATMPLPAFEAFLRRNFLTVPMFQRQYSGFLCTALVCVFAVQTNRPCRTASDLSYFTQSPPGAQPAEWPVSFWAFLFFKASSPQLTPQGPPRSQVPR